MRRQKSLQLHEHHGQYAPLQIRGPHGVKVIGENFIAQIPLQPGHPPGSIGVLAEHELAYPNVIENVMRIYAAYRALDTGGLMLHSAGLVREGVAYIFVGRSNAGKNYAHTQGLQGRCTGAEVTTSICCLRIQMALIVPMPFHLQVSLDAL